MPLTVPLGPIHDTNPLAQINAIGVDRSLKFSVVGLAGLFVLVLILNDVGLYTRATSLFDVTPQRRTIPLFLVFLYLTTLVLYLHNLILFLQTRNSAFYAYCTYIVVLAIQVVLYFRLFNFFPFSPPFPWYSNAEHASGVLSIVLVLQFSRMLLNTARHSPAFDAVLKAGIGIELIASAGLLLGFRWFFIPDFMFVGIVSDQAFDTLTFYKPDSTDGRFGEQCLGPNLPGCPQTHDMGLHQGIYTGQVLDSDGDGIPDDSDICADSILSSTVTIAGNDTGVPNTTDAQGCTVADRLESACSGDFRNHGQFVSCISNAVEDAVIDGLITDEDGETIVSSAARSPVGKPARAGKKK